MPRGKQLTRSDVALPSRQILLAAMRSADFTTGDVVSCARRAGYRKLTGSQLSNIFRGKNVTEPLYRVLIGACSGPVALGSTFLALERACEQRKKDSEWGLSLDELKIDYSEGADDLFREGVAAFDAVLDFKAIKGLLQCAAVAQSDSQNWHSDAGRTYAQSLLYIGRLLRTENLVDGSLARSVELLRTAAKEAERYADAATLRTSLAYLTMALLDAGQDEQAKGCLRQLHDKNLVPDDDDVDAVAIHAALAEVLEHDWMRDADSAVLETISKVRLKLADVARRHGQLPRAKEALVDDIHLRAYARKLDAAGVNAELERHGLHLDAATEHVRCLGYLALGWAELSDGNTAEARAHAGRVLDASSKKNVFECWARLLLYRIAQVNGSTSRLADCRKRLSGSCSASGVRHPAFDQVLAPRRTHSFGPGVLQLLAPLVALLASVMVLTSLTVGAHTAAPELESAPVEPAAIVLEAGGIRTPTVAITAGGIRDPKIDGILAGGIRNGRA